MSDWIKIELPLPAHENCDTSVDCLITDGVVMEVAYYKYSEEKWIVCGTQKPFTGDNVTHWKTIELPTH